MGSDTIFIITIILSKIFLCFLSFLNKGGSFPGKIALSLFPNILEKIVYCKNIVLVTGTNGKTTTANMIAQACSIAGKSVAINTKGDNLLNGIVTTIINHVTLFGHVKTDIIILEVDELTFPYIFRQIPVSSLIVTNFFRDQLDRSKEVEQLIKCIEKSIKNYKGNLILNGNDPNVVRLSKAAKEAKSYYYGITVDIYNKIIEINEGKFCPFCFSFLEYDTIYYSHIGKFNCINCDFSTPILDIFTNQIYDDSFIVNGECFKILNSEIYMVYNYMAVLLFAQLSNIPFDILKKSFLQMKSPIGRNEKFIVNNQKWVIHLIKNPTGSNEILKQIGKEIEEKIIIFVLNDNEPDGTDVSWIYDSDFEHILSDNTNAIVCCGQRPYDAALRIKYGGFDREIVVCENLHDAVKKGMSYSNNVYVLTTYTAMLPVRTIIRRESVCS